MALPEEREGKVAVKITVLGKSPSWQDVNGACSGYLVQDGEATVLLDCGNGVFSKLRRHVDYVDVDAVVISHLHADHFLDLVPFSYALTYAPRQQPVPVAGWPGTSSPARPLLYAPAGATEMFRRIVGAWGNEDLIEKAFDLREYTPDDVLQIAGRFTVRFQPVPHFTETNAVEFASMNGASPPRRFTFSADSSPSDDLVAFADGTDLLLIEATLPRPEREGPRGHMTPGEAGDHGRRARARRVVLTHLSDELDAAWAVDEASREYGSPVEVAAEGVSYEV